MVLLEVSNNPVLGSTTGDLARFGEDITPDLVED
jgi:hypothetical protein